jgi:hypothetical protein
VEVKAELQTELQALERLVTAEVDEINGLVKSAGVPLLSWGE